MAAATGPYADAMMDIQRARVGIAESVVDIVAYSQAMANLHLSGVVVLVEAFFAVPHGQTVRQYRLVARVDAALLILLALSASMRRPSACSSSMAGGKTINNCFQTNGTLIDDEWAAFFKRHNMLVGVSIDGPQACHDAYRRLRNGGPSFHRVMKGIEILNRHGVDWNAMAVVNNLNAEAPLAFYHFFKEIDCHFIQFTPVVERFRRHEDGRHLASPADDGAELAAFSVTPEQWGRFLCEIFDEWVREDVGNYFIQLFDATLANYAGVEPGVCSMASSRRHLAETKERHCLGNVANAGLRESVMASVRKTGLLRIATAIPD